LSVLVGNGTGRFVCTGEAWYGMSRRLGLAGIGEVSLHWGMGWLGSSPETFRGYPGREPGEETNVAP